MAVGDVVWGPAHGFASWPGQLVARRADGRWAVRWFGAERAPAALCAARLLTLSEGLDAHHAASTNHRKSRKLNTLLENAIQEAMAELDKKKDESSGGKKHDKGKTKEKPHRKNTVKIAGNPTKPADGTKLRSSR